jgi:peptidoglycan/LPS O-acetylase OafA/YrhL
MQSSAPEVSPLFGSSAHNRLHGIDALRGIAAVLVVLLHAGIPYMTNPMQYLAWPARDASPSSIVDAATWCAECFLMPLFFVLAGFFSAGMLASRGETAFLASRTRRLLTTQIVAAAVILPVCLYLWTLGWIADGLYVPGRYFIFGLPKDLQEELFGFAHLWFLQYLYIYCLALGGGSWLLKRFCKSGPSQDAGQSNEPDSAVAKASCCFLRCLDCVFASVWKPLIPVVPCAVIVYFDTRIVLGFYQTFVPVVSKLLYYAVYFFAGAMLCRHRKQLHVHARFGKRYLFLAAAVFAYALPLIRQHTVEELTGPRLMMLSGLLALFAWFAIFGLFSIFLHHQIRQNPVTRYLAEASFWVYLMHLPVVVLAQIAFAQLAVPTEFKFLMSGATALAITLVSYHVLVRNTWLGEFLDGCRRSPRQLSKAGQGPVREAHPTTIRLPMAMTDSADEFRERIRRAG